MDIEVCKKSVEEYLKGYLINILNQLSSIPIKSSQLNGNMGVEIEQPATFSLENMMFKL